MVDILFDILYINFLIFVVVLKIKYCSLWIIIYLFIEEFRKFLDEIFDVKVYVN